MSSFSSRYAMAKAMDQIKPQKLNNNVFFGPLNSLSQRDFLVENGIKFFISVGIPTGRVVEYVKALPTEEFIAIVVDGSSGATDGEEGGDVKRFRETHSARMQGVFRQVSMEGMGFGGRCLPQSEVVRQLHRPIAEYQSNIVAGDGIAVLEQFNDFITLFQQSRLGNILIYSANGNDERLTTLLVSQVLQTNMWSSVLEAFVYVKSLRPSIEDQLGVNSFWNANLVAFHERLRAKLFTWGNARPADACRSSLYQNNARKTKRRDETSCEEHEERYRYRSPELAPTPRPVATLARKRLATEAVYD
ncbi:uncharacterized protein Ecym_5049 [Eremothecium cymbalariae DBVPG|uniref:Uncharacterized protein n=1 Tax=Eremothecium cymbalariae (strain CBS 270.75 / DBVPG 7215 / KCTC 17166 / NRRL Y-17582) TaxID=931890 RepID=I6NCP9_ERECY|nr:hypothetical protein Ecym_5049 [Eremothecium cymbalariae DBVPG\